MLRLSQFKEGWNNLFNDKVNFNTLVSEILCDTTEYEVAPTPETGVMNWYQCFGEWRLEWIMEDTRCTRV